jgi:hypothetical protein
MKRVLPWTLVAGMGACFIVVATAGVWGSPTRGFKEGWGCEPERIGFTIGEPSGRGGSADELAAVRDLLPLLAEDGEVSLSRLEEAMSRRSGPSSFDSSSGELRIDGLIQATIGVSQLGDGTWVASNYHHCTRPPTSEQGA